MKTYYTRSIDDGCGRQNVTVIDGIITKQELVARSGYYTGDGNPEFIGQSKKVLRGCGFRKVRGPQVFNSVSNRWESLSDDIEQYQDDDVPSKDDLQRKALIVLWHLGESERP